MDYYSTLGVNKNASQKDIKSAYRKLASKHHPDRGGNEAEFKRIQEAYDVLGDEGKRAQYDNPRPHFNFNQGHGPFGPDFGHGFEDLFGFSRQRQYRNPDAVVDITVNIRDAYNGNSVMVDVGFAREIVDIPAGVRDGTKIRLHGKGHSRYKDVPPGDLVIRVSVGYPMGISRQNDDIYQRVHINAIDAMVGSEVNFDHFTGKTLKLKIPRGSQPGSKLRLSNYGMPNPQTGKPGNLFVVLEISIPNITDEKHLELLNTIRNEAKI